MLSLVCIWGSQFCGLETYTTGQAAYYLGGFQALVRSLWHYL